MESATTQKRLSGSQQKQKAKEMEASITLVLNHVQAGANSDTRELFSFRFVGKNDEVLHEMANFSSPEPKPVIWERQEQ